MKEFMQTIKGKRVTLLNDTHPENLTELLLSLRGLKREGFNDTIIHDPFLLPDIEKAIARILHAREKGERVMIFGDYDVDGISSTAALFLFLRDELHMQVSYRLPHRVHDGYGIKSYHIDEIAATGSKLVITVDCGTKDREPIEYARSLGLDVVVTDHHSCPEILPECVAVVNPKRSDSKYPFSSLSGSGVVWKLIHALTLRSEFAGNVEEILNKYVDIVSLGTVADCMPMLDENRTIVRLGLLQANNSHHPFFQVFSGLLNRPIQTEEDIGFFVGPMLNAGGRITTPYESIAALLATSLDAYNKVQELMTVNETRKGMSRDAYERALKNIDLTSPFLIVVDEKLEHGILGLVAAKLSEAFHKPTGVFTLDKGIYVGSLRSPEGIDLVKILDAVSDDLARYGGHAGAAGCSIESSRMSDACKHIQAATERLFGDHDTTPKITVDTVLNPAFINLSLVQTLETLRPFGQNFMSPLFMIQNVTSRIMSLGQTGEHIRWDNTSYSFEIIGFRMAEYSSLFLKKPHHLIGTLKTRTWRDQTTVQFQVIDAVPS